MIHFLFVYLLISLAFVDWPGFILIIMRFEDFSEGFNSLAISGAVFISSEVAISLFEYFL